MNQTMKAVVKNAGKITVRDVPVPAITADQVLVKVHAAGVCGTDLAIAAGTLPAPDPIILGHEITGTIHAAGENVPQHLRDRVGTDDLVTIEINTGACKKCFQCVSGVPTQCPSRKAIGIDIDGGMAEFIAIEHGLVHLLPPGLEATPGTLIEPLAAAIQTFEMMPVDDAGTSLIIGDGKLAQLILQVMRAREKINGRERSNIILLGHHDGKLSLAKRFGATTTINTKHMSMEDIREIVKELASERGIDVTIEATGNKDALDLAVQATRARGKVALKSTHGEPVPFNLTLAVVKELSFFGSRCGPFEKAIDMVRQGLIELEPLVTAVYGIDEAPGAFKQLLEKRPGVLKVIITP